MIEELKLLIPLLQDAGEGIFWLVCAILVKEVLIMLLAVMALVIIARMVLGFLSTHSEEQKTAEKLLATFCALGLCAESGTVYRSHESLLRELIDLRARLATEKKEQK